MKKIISTLCLLASGLILTSCTINKGPAPERYIVVNGSGSVLVKPDLVSLKFGIRTTERGVNVSVERNAVLTDRVINALKENGIAPEDISTYDYNIYQENQQTMPGRYTVTNTVDVLIRNPAMTGSVIDIAIANGANTLNSFEYLVSDKTAALRQARTLAIQDAQDAATLLAGASGSKVGIVMDVSENYNGTSTNNVMLKATFDRASSVTTPIESGTIAVTSNVTVKYTLE